MTDSDALDCVSSFLVFFPPLLPPRPLVPLLVLGDGDDIFHPTKTNVLIFILTAPFLVGIQVSKRAIKFWLTICV